MPAGLDFKIQFEYLPINIFVPGQKDKLPIFDAVSAELVAINDYSNTYACNNSRVE